MKVFGITAIDGAFTWWHWFWLHHQIIDEFVPNFIMEEAVEIEM
jgi:hypothetical protein